MKILFRTMRYNWRYIFTKSNKIAVALYPLSSALHKTLG